MSMITTLLTALLLYKLFKKLPSQTLPGLSKAEEAIRLEMSQKASGGQIFIVVATAWTNVEATVQMEFGQYE